MEQNQAVTALIDILHERTQNTDVRAGAARGLGHVGGPRAREALAKVMTERTENVDVRAAAAEALGRSVS